MSGCLRLDIPYGGARYDILLPAAPDATITKNDAKTFLVKTAMVEGACTSCGNGIKEFGEACDGGPFCGPTCFADIPACCVPQDQIGPDGLSPSRPVHGCPRILAGRQHHAVLRGNLPLGAGFGGYVCRADGSCSPDPIDPPISVCCQRSGSCKDGFVSDTRELWGFHNGCQGPMTGTTAPGASCGPLGLCVTAR